jgi:hypothetical protein
MGQDKKPHKFIATTMREYLNEQTLLLNSKFDSIKEGITAYHRSPIKFDKFDISKVSNNKNRQLSGWGIYFSNFIPDKEYGEYLYKVNLFKDKKGYILIDTRNPVQEDIVNKVVEALGGHNKKSDEVVEFSYVGWLFYNTLSRILGGDKKASLFLLKNGVDGLKRNIAKDSNDYVLFSDEHITIGGIEYDPY